MAELDRSAQLDSAAKIIDLRHIENSLLIFPPSSLHPPPPKETQTCVFPYSAFFLRYPLSAMSWWEFSVEVFAKRYFCHYLVAYTQCITAAEDRNVQEIICEGKKERQKSTMENRGRVLLKHQHGLEGKHTSDASMGKWHKVLQDLKPSWEAAWCSERLRSGLGATRSSQPFPPSGVFLSCFSGLLPSSNLCYHGILLCIWSSFHSWNQAGAHSSFLFLPHLLNKCHSHSY